MSSATRFEFPGLSELREALRKLPEDLTGEASHLVEGAGNSAVAQIRRNYAYVSGDLVAGVRVDVQRDRFAAGARVKSTSKHATLYEYGTQLRHTASGAGRGVMPPAGPGKAFVPVLIKERRMLYEQFRALLERHGLLVTGNA